MGSVDKIGLSSAMREYLRVHYISKRHDNLVNADVDPGATETYDLGDASHKWNNIYVKTLVADNITGSGSVNTFTDLTDTPGNYTGSGLFLTRVKNTVDGIEFADLLAGNGLSISHGASSITLDVGAGTLISVDASNVNLSNGTAQFQVPVTGASPYTPAWTLLSQFAGEGIGWDDSYRIDVGTASGLQVASDLLSIKLATNPGLQLSAAGLSVLLDSSSGLNLAAGGLELGTPNSLSVSSTNNVSGSTHTHAINSSSNPGAATSLLKSDTLGRLQLENISIGLPPTSARLHIRGTSSPQVQVEYDSGNYMTLYVTDAGQAIFDGNNDIFLRPGDDLFLDPDAAIIVQPGENPITPSPNYFVDLGTTTQQFRTIYAAELVVQTLVAQDVIATIGGEILVGPTTVLEQNLVGTDTRTITYSGAANNSAETNTQITVNVPAGTVGGDIMIAVVSFRNASEINLNSHASWNLIRTDAYNSNLTKTVILYRRATGSEPASYTFETSATADRLVGSIVVYENVNSIVPIDAEGAQANASSVTVTAPSVTTTHANTMLLFVGTTNYKTTFTAPGPMTERSDISTATAGAGGLTHEVAEQAVASVGATGARAATAVNAALNQGQLIALEPQYNMVVRHNQMATGDIIVAKARAVIEFFRVEGGASGAGPYTYPVGRDTDETGFNTWYAGDSIFNTGTTGDGFIDIYSQNNLLSDNTGPSMVGYVRNSSTYNDYIEHWAIGNLKNIYGTGAVNKYGVALGRYAASKAWISIDDTDGFKINYGTTPAVLGQWDISGNLSLGEVKANQANVYWNTSNKRLEFRGSTLGTVVQSYIDTDGSFISAGGNLSINATGGITLTQGEGIPNNINWDGTSQTIGEIYAWQSGINIDYITARAIANSSTRASQGIFGALSSDESTHQNWVRIQSQQTSGGSATDNFISFEVDGSEKGRFTTSGFRFEQSLYSRKGGTDHLVYGLKLLGESGRLTSTNFDGDAFSTTTGSKAAMNMVSGSPTFGAPSNAKGYLLYVSIRDSGSGSNDCYVLFGDTTTLGAGVGMDCSGQTNNQWERGMLTVKASASGEVYYQVGASGAGTFDMFVQVWGYYI